MSTFNAFRDELGLGTTQVTHVESKPTLLYLIGFTIILGVFGNLYGHYEAHQRKEAEEARIAAQQAAQAERARNRELKAKLDEIHNRAQRYQYQLDSARNGLLGQIENIERHGESISRVRQFLEDYPLPEAVRVEIGSPVDFSKAVGDDTYELQVQGVQDPQNVEKERQRIEEVLNVVRRYTVGFNDSVDYFNGEVSAIGLGEEFIREFGRPAAKPAAIAKPKEEPAPVVEPQVLATDEPVAEKPVQEPKPAARPAAPTKPRTVPIGNGGFRVNNNDW